MIDCALKSITGVFFIQDTCLADIFQKTKIHPDIFFDVSCRAKTVGAVASVPGIKTVID